MIARVLAICLALCAGAATAQQPALPLWELGGAAIVRGGSEYPGSSETSFGLTARPVLIYRGRIFEALPDGTLRLVPFRTDRFQLGVSVDTNAAVETRADTFVGELPDRDFLLEIGPEMVWRAAVFGNPGGDGTDGRLEVVLQTRAAISLGDNTDYVGLVLRPALRYRQNGVLTPGSRISMSIGPLFATEGVHDFYYEAPGLAYDATGGYLGTEARLSLRYPLTPRVSLLAGASLASHHGAANAGSPLHREDFSATAFAGISFALAQSQRTTTRDR